MISNKDTFRSVLLRLNLKPVSTQAKHVLQVSSGSQLSGKTDVEQRDTNLNVAGMDWDEANLYHLSEVYREVLSGSAVQLAALTAGIGGM